MNQIDEPPLSSLLAGSIDVQKDFRWSRFFQQIVQTLFRPTITSIALTFPITPAGSSSDVAVAFPKHTVALNDLPVVQCPAPPANTCFSWHIAAVDQVILRFNNYSAAAVGPFTGTFAVSVLNQ
jgi:hypothetical protein